MKPEIDLVIRGAQVVSPEAIRPASVANSATTDSRSSSESGQNVRPKGIVGVVSSIRSRARSFQVRLCAAFIAAWTTAGSSSSDSAAGAKLCS
jgi:hypothetical protein